MPLYEYQCESCNNRFEKIQKSYSDPAPEACPKCGKGPVRKLISSPAIQFKGTGWYITDYAKKSATEAGQTGGGTSGNSDQAGQSGSAAKAVKTDSTSSTSSTSSSGDTAAKPAKPSA
jgi:putative FmdB family regulatory protein